MYSFYNYVTVTSRLLKHTTETKAEFAATLLSILSPQAKFFRSVIGLKIGQIVQIGDLY